MRAIGLLITQFPDSTSPNMFQAAVDMYSLHSLISHKRVPVYSLQCATSMI